MGTRNLTVVRDLDNEVAVAQYGQWDGYPEGQGITALNILKNYGWEALAIGLTYTRFATAEELKPIFDNYANNDGWMTMEEGKRFGEDYPSLTRDTGADILRIIIETKKDILLTNEYDFKDDDLFCEGYYEVNLHSGKFISKYGGYEVEFDLDNLPTAEEYLSSFKSDLTSVA